MRFLHENPEDYRAKMLFSHFVCIAKRVTENVVNSNLFRGNAPRGVFMRFLHENPEDYRTKMLFSHFVCIAKRVTENVVNSNRKI